MELQASNEELTTLSDELRCRNLELSISDSDPSSVIGNVSIPILILGGDLRIRRMNSCAAAMLNLTPGDVGRPITDLGSVLDVPGLEALVAESVKSMALKERDVQDRRGLWHSVRVRPFPTSALSAKRRRSGEADSLENLRSSCELSPGRCSLRSGPGWC